jgi:predicted ABC-type ATPase
MPYFITDKAQGCSGWATTKEDGEVIGCHTTKQEAIDQMVAVSIAEKMEPGGERALPENYRPALAQDVPEGRACGNCFFYDDDVVSEDGTKAYCRKWDEFVDGGYYCNAWQSDDDIDDMDDVEDDLRAVNQDAPAYMRAAARRGLQYYADGKGGSGLVDKTIREARLMADGQVSDDKWIRVAAWIARHLDDLDSPDADPRSENYPSAGVVAHLLWGSGPSKTKARAAMQYAQGVAEKIRNEERHLQGKHDQKAHGSGGKSAGINPEAGKGNIKITSDMAADFQGGSAAPHLRQNQDGSYEFTPERQALHDKIVADAVAGVPTSADPTYYVMGGGPAAGKSTMLKDSKVSIPSKDKAVQVNPDDVKEKLPEWDRMQGDTNRAAYTHEESSYISKRIQAAAFETKRDVVADGTGDSSVSSMSNKIKKARDANYRVVGNYATVPTSVAIERANARGARTGRYVPESVIRGTHAGVSDVLPKIVSQFDEINLFDTTGDLVLLASGKNGKFTVNDQAGYTAFLSKAGE